MASQITHCKHQYVFYAVISIVVCVSMYSPSVTALEEQSWQPISSEQLVRLPVAYMDKYVERDFRDSALFAGIVELDKQVEQQLQHMHSLGETIKSASGEPKVELRHQLLVAKSEFIDMIGQKQDLEREALETRIGVYNHILGRIKDEKRLARDPGSQTLIASQQQARKRMQHATAMVDGILATSSDVAKTRYAEEYMDNLNRIEDLKTAIAKHAANTDPAIEGKTLTREQYIWHLMTKAEGQLAILDQERLMLTYMSRLVALDAHALEQEILFEQDSSEDTNESSMQSRLADIANIFIE